MRPLMSTQFKIPNCTSLPNTNPIHCFFSPHQSPLYNILHSSLIFFYHRFPHWNEDPQGILFIIVILSVATS